ncbi:hypothetical protein [Paraburkholderia fungorum]|uniref:hypothetical protein n=1 Tax=Paraburkholderia fungorum TaxID=134537 RepID=UPI00209205EE|nr:hypothetical protein [Paraburkholderia fungorum]USU18814.1 hypothetical protein NFE55_32175 [Paraburkholderia fungorum]USU29190.1 hypothetical protein NFS19_29395 [Paraburkholderia fungorum]
MKKKVMYGIKYYRQFIQTMFGSRHRLRVVDDWHEDSLADFQRWIEVEASNRESPLSPSSLGQIVSGVKVVMDYAYAHRFIDVRVYGLARPHRPRTTFLRSSYSDAELQVVLEALQPAIQWSLRLSDGYTPTGKGTATYRKPSTFHKREDLLWYWLNVVGNPAATRREVAGAHHFFYQSATAAFGGWKQFLAIANADAAIEGELNIARAQGRNPRFKPMDFSDPDNMVWFFENVMDCKPLPSKKLGRKSSVLAGAVRMKYGDVESWYRSMGTTLYVDHGVVIPLLYKLASETGLNAESLLTLQRDCFVKDDALTGQNYIVYWKLRSNGEKRFPLSVLDEADADADVIEDSQDGDHPVKFVRQLSIKQSIVVEKTVRKILALTAPLAVRADAHSANLLFLYELRGGGQIGTVGPLTADAVSKWSRNFFFRGEKRDIRKSNLVVNISRFRPTLVTDMVKRGFDIYDISALLGHRSVLTTAEYLDKHGLEPQFEIEMRSQLEQIRKNHREIQEAAGQRRKASHVIRVYPTSGLCGCRDPFNPPERIRRATNYQEGQSCGYYSMCLTCKHIVITDQFLPRLFKHLYELELELDKGLGNEPMRDQLYLRQISVLRHVLAPDFMFSMAVLKRGDEQSKHHVDDIYDEFLYH